MKSIDEQIAAIETQWPEFVLKERTGRTARWEGTLVPVRRPHLVRIRYGVPSVIERFTINQIQPRVQVIKPTLQRHPNYEQGPTPHVYRNPDDTALPYLCLFNPTGDEWEPGDLIAETILFWAARWLFFYEGWLATKRWRGGGGHLVPAIDAAAGGKRIETV